MPNIASNGIPVSPNVVAAQALVEQFVETKRNLLSKVTSVFSSSSSSSAGDSSSETSTVKGEKVDSVVAFLRSQNVWPEDARVSLAKRLSEHLDHAHTEHCKASFPTQERLADHKLTCPLRPTACVNPGCSEAFSAVSQAAHNVVCPYFLLPCWQKCPLQIARKDMKSHCETTCDMKVVECPFKRSHCDVIVHQGTLRQHLLDERDHHLLLLNTHVNAQAVQLQEHMDSTTQLAVAIKAVDASVTVTQVTIKDLTARLADAEKDSKQTRRKLEETVAALEKDNAGLKRTVGELEKELKGIRKEFGQALKATLQGPSSSSSSSK